MNPVKKVFRYSAVAVMGVLLLVSCSGGDDRDAKTSVSALIQTNTHIVAFGHISVEQLLQKLDYRQLPKVNALIGEELPGWQRGLQMEKPVYFAVEAPFGHDGAPAATYAFFDVKNKDSLVDKFVGMGYALEAHDGMESFREGDVSVGIREKLAIMLLKGGEYDHKQLLATAFDQASGEKSTGKTATILNTKGDFVSALSIERLYTTSNTSLSKLSEAKKKELDALISDGFIQTVVNFEKGRMTVKASNLFSEKLKDRLFFKEDPSATVISKLGSGSAWMGISGNLDIHKFESFMKDFAPEAEQNLTQAMPGGMGLALAMVGENPMGKLFSGQFGVVMTGNPKSANGMLPQFNFFFGLGSQSDFIRQKATDYATLMQLQKKGDAFVTEGMAIAPRQDGIYGYTIPESTGGKLEIPGFADKFGKNTFSMFIHFGKIDVKSLELDDELKVLEIMDTFVINADRDGSEMILTAKDKSTNILKQAGMFYAKMLSERIGGLSI